MSDKKKSRVMKFGEMMDALLEAHKNVKNKKYGYNGPVFTSNSMLCTSPNINEQFSKEEFEFRVEHKGKKPIELILNAALQLGIQQGIYLCSEEPLKYLEVDDYELFESQIKHSRQFYDAMKKDKKK